ncbi:unnamed protein product [Lampetra fluviatilis]
MAPRCSLAGLSSAPVTDDGSTRRSCSMRPPDDAGRISHAPRHASSARTRTSADSGDMCSLSALGGLSA